MQFCGSVVRAVQLFVQFSGSCSSVVRAVQWFMQFSGSCSSVDCTGQWFVQFRFSGSSSSDSVVRPVQIQWFVQFSGSCSSVVRPVSVPSGQITFNSNSSSPGFNKIHQCLAVYDKPPHTP